MGAITSILGSNKAINNIRKQTRRIIPQLRSSIDKNMTLGQKMRLGILDSKAAPLNGSHYTRKDYKRKIDWTDRGLSLMMNDNGSYSKKKVAGAAAAGLVAANTAFRVASGGGLYRDYDGNFNVIGIPFV